jgi:uncharacterized membrane protein
VAARRSEFLRRPPAGAHVAAAVAIGVVCTALVWVHTLPAAALLLGWDIAAVIYLTMIWPAVSRMDAASTARLAGREDPSTPVGELIVVGASIAALVAVGFAILRAGHAPGATKAFLIALGTVSVVLSWTLVHTIYMLRYARNYYSEPVGGIDFNEADMPAYTDFAYFSFTLGMTFQVSDTNITTKQIRRLALHHALLSYLFGAVILAVAINVVASLLQ